MEALLRLHPLDMSPIRRSKSSLLFVFLARCNILLSAPFLLTSITQIILHKEKIKWQM